MRFSIIDALDILIVSFVVYRLILNLRGTRATAIIKGLVVLVVASGVSRLIGFPTVSWLLEQGTTVILVALPVVFYPELRRTLERLGRRSFFRPVSSLDQADLNAFTDQVLRAVRWFTASTVGALIVIERDVGLEEYVETGVRIDSAVSAELLMSLFFPNTALHDGAVIIRGDRIVAAGCFLPLSDNLSLDAELGTRHRAALGVSEETDAFVIVVSEETGTLSVAVDGVLERGLSDDDLRRRLREACASERRPGVRQKRVHGRTDRPSVRARARSLLSVPKGLRGTGLTGGERATRGMLSFAVAFSLLLWVLAPRPQGTENDRFNLVERPVVAAVEVRDLPGNLQVVEMQEWVTVHLRSLDLDSIIDIDRVHVYVDMRERASGLHTVPVTVVPPFGVQVVRVDPPAVDVQLEEVVTDTFPVRVAAVGLPPDARVDVLPPEPESVEVIGPSGHLRRVEELIAPVRIRSSAGTHTDVVALQAIDDEGTPVTGVRIEPERVRVTIVVTPEPESELEPLPEEPENEV